MGRYDRTVAPSGLILTLAQAKRYLAVDHDEDDQLIIELISDAELVVELELNRALRTQTWRVVFDDFPGDCIRLDRPPVQSVTSVEYLLDDVWTTVDSDDYTVATAGEEPAYVRTVSGWPTPDVSLANVRVTFVAGYTAVPGIYKAAVRMALVSLYETRSPEVAGATLVDNPMFQRLLGNRNMVGC